MVHLTKFDKKELYFMTTSSNSADADYENMCNLCDGGTLGCKQELSACGNADL